MVAPATLASIHCSRLQFAWGLICKSLALSQSRDEEPSMTASVKPLPIDRRNRDHLRELWRLKALESSEAEDRARRLEEGKKLVMADAVTRLKGQNEKLSEAAAERMVRTSDQYKQYLRTMHDARRAADDAKIMAEDANRLYWEQVGAEADERTERRMSR